MRKLAVLCISANTHADTIHLLRSKHFDLIVLDSIPNYDRVVQEATCTGNLSDYKRRMALAIRIIVMGANGAET